MKKQIIIPHNWKLETVGSAFNICNSLRFPISQSERKKISGEYPYYGPTKIQDYINEYRLDGTYAIIGEDGDHFLKWKELPMTLLVTGKFNVNNHAHVIQGENNLTEWFFYYFNHKPLTPFLTRQGAGRYKLTKKALSQIPCLIPPIKEQELIVNILSHWDHIISLNQKLIILKNDRKKGLMQKLLSKEKNTRKTSTHWVNLKIRDIGKIPVKKPITKITKHKLITVKLYTKGLAFNIGKTPKISSSGRPYYIRNKGEILIGRQNIHNGGIGLVDEIFDGHICSNAITSFLVDEDKVFLPFILYYLSNSNYYKKIESYMGGTGQKELSEKQFLNLNINIPFSLNEQKAIAKILLAVDKEIDLLKQKTEKLKEQKKGIMQVLLTGKKRLKIKE